MGCHYLLRDVVVLAAIQMNNCDNYLIYLIGSDKASGLCKKLSYFFKEQTKETLELTYLTLEQDDSQKFHTQIFYPITFECLRPHNQPLFTFHRYQVLHGMFKGRYNTIHMEQFELLLD